MGEIQCLHENDLPLPLKCIPVEEVEEKRCNGINDCGTIGANDEKQENGEACLTTCSSDELQCFHGENRTPLPLECIAINQRLNSSQYLHALTNHGKTFFKGLSSYQ